MNDHIEHAKEVIINAASSPKAATVVAASAASVGAAQQIDLITGWMARASVALGMCTAAVVLTIQLIKLARELKHYRRENQ